MPGWTTYRRNSIAISFSPTIHTMSRFGAEYQISRATGRCAATDEPLAPGAICVATLCERTDDDGFDRKDFSLDAWESGARPQGLFSYWKTVVPKPDAKPRLLLDDQ